MTVAFDHHDMTTQELSSNAQFLHAFLECSDEIQEGVKEMLHIVFDPESDAQERSMALATVADALFPNLHNGQLGMDLAESEKDAAEHVTGFAAVLEELDKEEMEFADRLKRWMSLKGIKQTELAKKIGVGQPAISNMLNRQCRPQRGTVECIAEALDISPAELWPKWNDAS